MSTCVDGELTLSLTDKSRAPIAEKQGQFSPEEAFFFLKQSPQAARKGNCPFLKCLLGYAGILYPHKKLHCAIVRFSGQSLGRMGLNGRVDAALRVGAG